MNKLYNTLAYLLSNSIKRLATQKLCTPCSWNEIKSSLSLDLNKDIIISSIALKVRAKPEDILGNINLKDSQKVIKEILIHNNRLFFYINKNYKKNIYYTMLQKVICGIYGQLDKKQATVIINYNSKTDEQTLSYFREQYYIHSLINLYSTCGYNVTIPNNIISFTDKLKLMQKLEDHIIENNYNTFYQLNGIDFPLIKNVTITPQAQYILSYLNLFNLQHDKIISICGKKYTIDDLQKLNARYNLNNILLQADPFIYQKQLSSNINYKDISNNTLEQCKYEILRHNINQQFIFRPERLTYIWNILKVIDDIFYKMLKLNDMQVYILIYSHWNLTKYGLRTCTMAANYEHILESAAEQNKPSLVINYLFELCHIASPIIYEVSTSLNRALAKKYTDKQSLSQKLRLVKIVKYIILHILNLFEISPKEKID